MIVSVLTLGACVIAFIVRTVRRLDAAEAAREAGAAAS